MLIDCAVTVRPMPRSLTAAAITRTDATPRPTHFFLVIFISQCGVNGDSHSMISVLAIRIGLVIPPKPSTCGQILLAQLLHLQPAETDSWVRVDIEPDGHGGA